jgi:hypothetical protein
MASLCGCDMLRTPSYQSASQRAAFRAAARCRAAIRRVQRRGRSGARAAARPECTPITPPLPCPRRQSRPPRPRLACCASGGASSSSSSAGGGGGGGGTPYRPLVKVCGVTNAADAEVAARAGANFIGGRRGARGARAAWGLSSFGAAQSLAAARRAGKQPRPGTRRDAAAIPDTRAQASMQRALGSGGRAAQTMGTGARPPAGLEPP